MQLLKYKHAHSLTEMLLNNLEDTVIHRKSVHTKPKKDYKTDMFTHFTN